MMISNKRLKAKVIAHHKENLYHLETGVEFDFSKRRKVSIRKRNNRWVGVGISSEECVFCEAYFDELMGGCGDCPILVRNSRYGGCSNTPWGNICKAFATKNVQDAIEAEKAEIVFLESLEV